MDKHLAFAARLLALTLTVASCSSDNCGKQAMQDSSQSRTSDVSTQDRDVPMPDIDGGGVTGTDFPDWLFNEARSDAYCENSNDQRISYPNPTREFTRPSPVTLSPFVKGRDELLDSIPGDRSGRTISASGVDPSLRPRSSGAYNLFAEEGQSVTLFTSVLIDDQDIDGAVLTSNIYLGYESVKARFALMGPDFGSPIVSRNTSGFRVAYSSVVGSGKAKGQLVNEDGTFLGLRVTVPPKSIPHDGFHELGWHITLAGPSNHLYSRTKRFALYIDGYSRRSHDCLVRYDARQPTKPEDRTFSDQVNFFYGMSIWPEGQAGGSQDEVLGPHSATPGQEVTLGWAAEAANTNSDTDSASVAIPTLNGLPVSDPVFFVESGQDSGRREDYRTTASGEFTFSLPEEPGIYDVRVVEFPDPYRIITNLEGKRFDSVSADSMSVKQGSPVVRYVVE